MLRLALADLWHERVLFLCSALGCAAVLAPLIVLFGLRQGVVAGLRAELLEDPRAREVVSIVNRTLEPAVFERLGADPRIAFIVPRTRALSATIVLENPDRQGGGSRVELLPTGEGDPLLPGLGAMEADALVLSAAAQQRLGLQVGGRVLASVARSRDGQREILTLPMRVAAAAPLSAATREAAFATLPVLLLVEDFLDGRAAPDARPGDAMAARARPFAGFRLHAARLEDVPALDAELRLAGIEVASRAEAVAGLLRLDRNLALLFLAIAGAGGAGYLVSLGVGLWAQVERKRRDLALLSLLGMKRRALLALPIIQAAAVALAGAAMAFLVAAAVAHVLNGAFAGTVTGDRPVCLLTARMGLAAAGVTLAGAVLAAVLAGLRAASVPPAQGLAEG
ncbi:FtsX-like permease family protein [Roseomonas sp. PWR1]|uniref:FtsX-like permease family protein n=1 Tax=Roseomonas nitratireducens TaxID=2820810 RepID=A0ABS4AQB8_9PROT|nr:FtsX-like permease family protein [Neoroseomonas nitratireducens]MBP0462762.1 FtsX-like permease family protein [Neoroseomonas nitratireducens]